MSYFNSHLQLEEPVLLGGAARMPGASADALFALDEDEHRCRQREGVGAVTRLSVLHERLAATGQFDGVLEGLESQLGPAGWVTQVEVRAASPVAGMATAALFRAVAPVVVVTGWPRGGLRDLALEASALGVGLAIDVAGVRETLVTADFVAGVFDAATWAFHERAYAAWLSSERAVPARVQAAGHQGRPAA
jgi:hypothetical protein